jgi:predicted CopG family antitoxin
MTGTTVKEKILKALEEMPQDVSFSEVMERLYFLQKVEQGIKQVADGDMISHADAKARMKKWQG